MKRVLIPLAEGCEELEAVTLIDLLRRAQLDVVTAALGNTTVECSRGTKLLADCTIDEVMDEVFDLIVLPGGLPGADNLNKDPRIHRLLSEMIQKEQLVAAICAAPRVLVSNDAITEKHITAYPGSLEGFDTKGFTVTDTAVVVDGNVITSKGPGTAMDLALTLIEKLLNAETRIEVEQPLQRC